MNPISQHFTRYRAARNIMRLFGGKLTAHDVKHVNGWRSPNPEYQAEFFGTAELLADIESLADDPQVAALMDSPIQAESESRTGRFWPGVAIAASVLLMVTVVTGVYLNQQDQSDADTQVLRYVTRIGEQKKVELGEGSIVTLNTGTEIMVDITAEHRRILLVRGEAFFDIASDPERPFGVNVGLHSVSVLGTQFNIRKAPEQFSVAVLQGTVAIHQQDETADITAPVLSEVKASELNTVSSQDEMINIQSPGQYRLTAGWVAEFDVAHDRLSSYAPRNIDKLQGWRDGIIEFEGTPLYRVIQELNRYSAKKILIEDADIMNLEIYSVLRVGHLTSTLAGLESTLPVKVSHHFDRIVVTGRN